MPTETLTIETAGSEDMMYTFTVDGTVTPTDAGGGVSAAGELVSEGGNVTIDNRADGTVQVNGKTGGDFGDAFTIDGTLTSFTGNIASSMMILSLGGTSFTPSALPLSTGSGNGDTGNGDTGNGDTGNGDTGNGGDGGQQPIIGNVSPAKAMLALGTFGVVYTVASDIDD